MSLREAVLLLRKTMPFVVLRAAIAGGASVGVPAVIWLLSRLGEGLGLGPVSSALAAVILCLGICALLWLSVAGTVTSAHLTVLALAAGGLILPKGRAQITEGIARVRAVAEGTAPRLLASMGQAHRDALRLVQGLHALLPSPLRAVAPLSRLGVQAVARPMADAATAQALIHAETSTQVGAAAAAQVALSADSAHGLMTGLVRPVLVSVLLAVAVWAVLVLTTAPLLGDSVWPLRLCLPVLWTWALWILTLGPVLAAIATLQRHRMVADRQPADPWLARLDTSSQGFRRVAAWPGAPAKATP